MSRETIQETFLDYCKNQDISAEEINNPSVFFNNPTVKALTDEMDKDKAYAEEVLVFIAKELKTMLPYRACLSAFFIGLYGERGVSSIYADRDLLDYFDGAIKYVMQFVVGLAKQAGVRQLTPNIITQIFSHIDVEKMTKANPQLIQIIKGLTTLCTGVMSRISQSRPMRGYLRETKVGPVCLMLSPVFPAAGYVSALLDLVEQQQVLVLFPNYKIGFDVTVEEIDSNFSMFSLLQIELAKEGYMGKLGLPHFTYNGDAAKALNREVPFNELPNPLPDLAAFNYYTLHPIIKAGRGKYQLDTDYICDGKEKLDALGTLDGRHILLADKMTVKQTWANAAVYGIHPNQHPKLTINRVLPKEEYEKWVDMVEEIGAYKHLNDADEEE